MKCLHLKENLFFRSPNTYKLTEDYFSPSVSPGFRKVSEHTELKALLQINIFKEIVLTSHVKNTYVHLYL